MRIVVHSPTVEAPDGAEGVAAVVVAAIHEQLARLDTGSHDAPATMVSESPHVACCTPADETA